MMTKFFADDQGATAIEYGLLAALISIIILVSAKAIGTTLSSKFSQIDSAIK